MARSEEKDLSVFEFIYVDWGRVANLIAQLDPNGVLTALETVTTMQNNKAIALGGSGEAGIPLVKKGGVTAEISGHYLNESTINRQFDARDLAPQTLLSLLSDRGLIERKKNSFHLGDIALMTGKLHLLDLGVIGDGWGDLSGADDNAAGHIAKTVLSDPVGFLFGEQKKAWIPMRRDSWQLGMSTMMTHGHQIAGKWSFLGVISKTPQEKPPTVPQNMFNDGHEIPGILRSMDDARENMGCPLDFHAMTPLLGFREIGSQEG